MKKKFGNNKIQGTGFTLIELVMVLVLLGILAATALPKYADLTSSAHISANRGIGGGFQSAVNIAHDAWIALGGTPVITNVALECPQSILAGNLGNIHVNPTGWPDNAIPCAQATAPGPAAINAPTIGECIAVWTNVLNNPVVAQSTACTIPQGGSCYQVTLITNGCQYTRNPQVVQGINIQYNVATGAINITP